MPRRNISKSVTAPVSTTAVISYVRELPGAVFYDDAINDDESIEYAARLQRIRREYENDDCQEMLWHDLSQMGFSSKEICEFVVNPAAITNCGYGTPMPLR
jgi:hypothetical protein